MTARSEKQAASVNVSKELGNRIRQLRLASHGHFTQEDLAERAEISVSFLSMIERGERAPHIDTLANIARALEVSLCELFLFAGEEARTIDPVLKPLAEFVRSRSLTRRDVEKLVHVARAVFDR